MSGSFCAYMWSAKMHQSIVTDYDDILCRSRSWQLGKASMLCKHCANWIRCATESSCNTTTPLVSLKQTQCYHSGGNGERPQSWCLYCIQSRSIVCLSMVTKTRSRFLMTTQCCLTWVVWGGQRAQAKNIMEHANLARYALERLPKAMRLRCRLCKRCHTVHAVSNQWLGNYFGVQLSYGLCQFPAWTVWTQAFMVMSYKGIQKPQALNLVRWA